MAVSVSLDQTRRFMLGRQGLLGAGRFSGDQGLKDYVKMVGCVQFDPVDVCGKSHELALLARIKGFDRDMLDRALYKERALIDYFDKNMCILPTEDWPYMEPTRTYYREHSRGRKEVDAVAPEILRRVHEMGSASSQELDMKERVDWYWSATTLSRAALETLYFRGDLVVHHKRGSVKSYALASDCLPKALLDAPYPFENEAQRHAWQVLRRVGAVGMLPNGASDAWLGMDGFKAEARSAAFGALLKQGRLAPVMVESVQKPLYIRAEELPMLEECAQKSSAAKRARFLAPLDCMMWDRRLIAALFGFEYRWEIYTPVNQRKYAHYTLPVLYGERFAGRAEPVCDRKAKVLRMKRFWPEKDFRVTDAFASAMVKAAAQLQAFHGLDRTVWGDDGLSPLDAGFVQPL